MNKLQSKIPACHYIFLIITVSFLTACGTNKPIRLFDKQPEGHSQIAALKMPIDIDVVYFDGVKHHFFPAFQEIVSYTLLPGDHIVGLKYQNMVKNEDGDLEQIKSKIVIIRFNAEPGETYLINFEKPTTFEAAVKLEKSFQVSLSNHNKIIATSVSAIESPTSDWINDNIERSIASIFNNNDFTDTNMPTDRSSVNDHLTFWWNKASKEEKMEFKNWLKDR